MAHAKITITLDAALLARLDQQINRRRFPNRSLAVQEALREKLGRVEHARLARECAKLDPSLEQRLAEGLEDYPES
jgi:Arc/MetJ-type ribon-helix-helix transcriptional regulator